jgi:FkbM family methyltransferase
LSHRFFFVRRIASMNFSAIPRASTVGKVLRLPLRLLPGEMEIRIMQGPLRGYRWIVGSANHGCWLGSYEQTKQRLFAAAVRPGMVIYDLGANVGFYSLLASSLTGASGRVFSFEPAERNLVYLRRHIARNRVANCVVWPVAVGGHESTAHFSAGSGPCEGHLASEGTPVRVVALDPLIASGELPPPQLIKCDIEGAELDALHGARSALELFRPKIFLATHGAEMRRRCHQFLQSLGYRLSSCDEMRLEETDEIIATP